MAKQRKKETEPRQRDRTDDAAPDRNPVDAPPDQDLIATRAYELYEKRGRGEGRDLDDWLEAEREVRSRPRRREDLGEKTDTTTSARPIFNREPTE